MPTLPNLLTSAQVCERGRIDRSTLSRHVQRGHITPHVRIEGSGQMLFLPRDVDRYLQWYDLHRRPARTQERAS